MDAVAIEALAYWINERERIRRLKASGAPRPWSPDDVFQTTYFTNVHREDDRVTRWIRGNWNFDHKNYEFAMVMARIINKPETLEALGFPFHWDSDTFLETMDYLKESGATVWGNAYIYSTNGKPIEKARHAAGMLTSVHCGLPVQGYRPTLAAYHGALMRFDGLGSFLAAQVVADLKNTDFHPLAKAEDWWTWAAPGPGSLRGLTWILGEKVTPSTFTGAIEKVYAAVLPKVMEHVGRICMQDFQNCLCEFDKYMRVKTGTGRSKRMYNAR
jgi:hypothetical protein